MMAGCGGEREEGDVVGGHEHSPFEALDNDLFNIHDELRWR